jgi:hypothetical protein
MRSPATVFFLCFALGGTAAIAGPASLTDAQREKLAALVHSDPEAGKEFAGIQKAADAALDAAPNPIRSIRSEGKLKNDPEKIASEASLADMRKIEALGYACAVTQEDKYATASRKFLLAWAGTNVSRGDPIDDTGLEPLIVTYDLVRKTVSPADRGRIDTYLRQVHEALVKSDKAGSGTSKNNWNSHRIKIMGLIAYVLEDKQLIARAVEDFKKQIEQNLEPDGSSLDFHERDALHYHCYDLEPLLTFAIAARQTGIDLYQYRARSGASLPKSVAFLVPYADGSKTHAEFVTSKVAFDKKRADSGDAHYKAGTLFDPKAAKRTIELAAYFDPSLDPLALQLNGGKGRFGSWRMVLNAVQREGTTDKTGTPAAKGQ